MIYRNSLKIVDQGTGLLRDYNHDTLIDLLNTIIAAMKDSNDEQKKQINDFIEEYTPTTPFGQDSVIFMKHL